MNKQATKYIVGGVLVLLLVLYFEFYMCGWRNKLNFSNGTWSMPKRSKTFSDQTGGVTSGKIAVSSNGTVLRIYNDTETAKRKWLWSYDMKNNIVVVSDGESTDVYVNVSLFVEYGELRIEKSTWQNKFKIFN